MTLARWWTVVRMKPAYEYETGIGTFEEPAQYRSEWVRAYTADGAAAMQTALTNAGYTVTLFVFAGRHSNRIGG